MILAASTFKVSAQQKPLQTVSHVDIERYMGKWYEIAKYPNRFQKNCVAATANYRLMEDGNVEVINTCRKDSVDGELKDITGKAWVVDKETNAKLKVQFFWPFSGAYWIIELDKDYQYVVVGHPKRKFLWILARTPKIDDSLYKTLMQKIKVQGYDLSKIEKTPQVSE